MLGFPAAFMPWSDFPPAARLLTPDFGQPLNIPAMPEGPSAPGCAGRTCWCPWSDEHLPPLEAGRELCAPDPAFRHSHGGAGAVLRSALRGESGG